ncbi:hypothetical protein COO60DRAFT_1488537 [Scenedesmus sp. NREL 46B-D3]|nr:hypothetical protein COO60DRAFT_1488537 [Scenedesmus sp. NREL 46B-D3]
MFRMDKEAFDELHVKYGHRMARLDTNYRQAVPSEKRMAIFLSYLAHGHKQQQLAILWDVSQPVVSRILADGRAVFRNYMVDEEIHAPSGADVDDIAAGFEALAGMPGCVGAVDGTFFHI